MGTLKVIGVVALVIGFIVGGLIVICRILKRSNTHGEQDLEKLEENLELPYSEENKDTCESMIIGIAKMELDQYNIERLRADAKAFTDKYGFSEQIANKTMYAV